jgi:hypothetical protein
MGNKPLFSSIPLECHVGGGVPLKSGAEGQSGFPIERGMYKLSV